MKTTALAPLVFLLGSSLLISNSLQAQLTTFTNPTPAMDDQFGFAIASMGTDRVLFGVPFDDTGGLNCGAAYLFSTNATLITTFTNPAPASGDYFGWAIAAVGTDRVLIGAHREQSATNIGIAYLFNTNGTLLTTITNPTPAPYEYFGDSLAVVGSDRLLIGALGDMTGASGAGAAYLFNTNGILLTTFTNPTPYEYEYFGSRLAAVGTVGVLIGAYRARDSLGTARPGAAYLFSTNGTLITTFTDPASADYDYFGFSVAGLDNDRVLIGAVYDYTGRTWPGAGAAYLFNTNGTLLKTFANPIPAGYNFGGSLAAVGLDRVLISAPPNIPGGVAYLFDTNGVLLTTLTNSTPVPSLSGELAVLGTGGVVLGAHGANNGTGAAYLFRVPESPVVVTHPQSRTVIEGGAATFQVVVNGVGPMSYHWFRNTSPIAGATNSAYSISSVPRSDAGVYYVAVSNALGSVISSNAWLTVLKPPVVSTNCNSIASSPQSRFALSSAFDGTNFLVAVRGSASSSNSVGFQRMSPTGQVGSFITNGHSIAKLGKPNGPFLNAPQVAFGSSNYLMAWTDVSQQGQPQGADVYAQFIGPDGNLGSLFSVTSIAGDQDTSGVAYDGMNFMVVYAATNGLRGRFVSPAVPSGAVNTFTLTNVSDSRSAVAFGGGQYLVVWIEGPGDGNYSVKGRLVAPSGEMGQVVSLSLTNSYNYNPISVAYGAGQFMVVWNYNATSNAHWHLRGRVVTTNGNLSPAAGELIVADSTEDDLAFGNSVVFNGEQFLVVRTKGVFGANGAQGTVVGQYWSTNGVSLGGSFIIAAAQTNQLGVGLSHGGGQSLVLVHNGIFTPQADLCAKFVSLGPGVGPLLLTDATVSNSTFQLKVFGPPGVTAILETSATLSNWTGVSTNLLPVDPLPLSLPVGTNFQQYYRGRIGP